jgi:GntR family transcriptional regulator/MocR family aminotransferase
VTPLSAQIAAQIRDAVSAGVLGGGERLPSSRELARVLAVSRTVVTAAYTQLFAEGWLEGRHGSGTYVADVSAVPAPLAPPIDADATSAPVKGDGDAPARIQLLPGTPWAQGIDPAMWRRAFRYAGTQHPLASPDPAGLPELRAEATGYLRRARALVASPEQVLITRGVASGLVMLAAAVVSPGDRVGLEEPGYTSARQVLTRAGAVVVPCRADAHGIVVAELPRDLKLVYTTPAHQYPLGGRLTVSRRQALIAWAHETGAIIVEDDYDSEFRYDVAPLPSMFGMDPEVVVYLGTTSKMLTPALGVGWLASSPALVAELAELRRELGDKVPEPVQHAVLSMLRTGDLERHVRKMRLEYAQRRVAVVAALGARRLEGGGGDPGLDTGFRLLGDTAGLHVVLELRDANQTDRIIREAAQRGVEVWPLSRYFAGPVTTHGVVIGYGTASFPQVRKAAAILRDLLTRRPPPAHPAHSSHAPPPRGLAPNAHQ